MASLIGYSPAFRIRLRFAPLWSALLQNGEQSQRHLLWHFKNRDLRRLDFIVVSDTQKVFSLTFFHQADTDGRQNSQVMRNLLRVIVRFFACVRDDKLEGV